MIREYYLKNIFGFPIKSARFAIYPKKDYNIRSIIISSDRSASWT
jgi:hypothetical protein